MKKVTAVSKTLVDNLQKIIDNMPFDVWFKDAGGKYVIVNKNYEYYTGKSKDEIIGKNDYDIYCKSEADIYVAGDNAAILGTAPVYYEVEYAKGKFKEEHKAAIFDESGNLVGTTGFSRDITERKKVQDALNEYEQSKAILLSNLPGMAYRSLFDEDLSMAFLSEGCYELTGYTSKELLEKRPSYYDLILPEHKESLLNKWKQERIYDRIAPDEYEIKTASGEIKWVWEQYKDICDTKQGIIYTEGLIIDITKRKLAEKALQESEERFRKMYEEVQYLSFYDQLTGLYNRRFYEEELKRIDKAENLPIALITADINGLKLLNDAFGHLEGDRALIEFSNVLKQESKSNYVTVRTGGDEFIVLLANTDTEEVLSYIDRVRLAYENFRVRNISCSASFGWGIKRASAEDLVLLFMQAEDMMYRNKLADSPRIRKDIIKEITSTLFEHNEFEKSHAERVSRLCEKIGYAFNMNSEEIKELKNAGLMHDIGKIGIDAKTLNKSAPLTESEVSELKRHPEIGYHILKTTMEFAPTAEYILFHHERIDGKGYPRGLRGEEIPLQSKIISVADAFDAMTSRRLNGPKLSEHEALNELLKHAGTKFDPKVVNVLMQILQN